MAFMDRTGQVQPVRLEPDGSVPVSVAEDQADSVPDLLTRLCWEIQELRRVQCEATEQLFTEYPG